MFIPAFSYKPQLINSNFRVPMNHHILFCWFVVAFLNIL